MIDSNAVLQSNEDLETDEPAIEGAQHERLMEARVKTIRALIKQVYGEEITPPLPPGALGSMPETPVESSSWGMIIARIFSVGNAAAHTCLQNKESILEATRLLAQWMDTGAIVRVLGAGRALLAAGMPANRLAHGGAQLSFMGGMVPLPNSDRGGGIIACSASGHTHVVLDAMRVAKTNNPKISIIGLAAHDAEDFRKMCDIFIGIHVPKSEYRNPLSALADTEEYVISELLDGLVVFAGQLNGFDDETWRRGHEDIGPTGPYSPKRK